MHVVSSRVFFGATLILWLPITKAQDGGSLERLMSLTGKQLRWLLGNTSSFYLLFPTELSDLGTQEVISLIQRSRDLPPHLRQLLRDEVCNGKWPNVFPIKNWCQYDAVIQQKHASFMERFLDTVVRGNEVSKTSSPSESIKVRNL